jgi:hypothetical protein
VKSSKREAKERQDDLTKTQEVRYAHELKSAKAAENNANSGPQVKG